MRPSHVVNAIRSCFRADLRPFLWGAPGIGKTALVTGLAQEYGRVDIVHGLVMDSVDCHGFPFLVDEIAGDGKVTKFSRPGFWPQGDKGVLFLDEFAAAPGMVMTAFSQLLLNRRIGEHILPNGWNIVLASNRLQDRAVVHALPTPIANRCVHIDFEVAWDDFRDWALKAGIHEDVIAFLNFQTQYLHDANFVKEKEGKRNPTGSENAFCSPRAWEFVSKLLTHGEAGGEIEQDLIQGIVGKVAANDFQTFLQLKRKAPSLDAIIANPKKASIPKELHIRYAVCLGLSRRMEKKTMAPICTYLERSDEPNGIPVDLMIMAMKVAVERDPLVAKTPEFITFAKKHSEEMGLQK